MKGKGAEKAGALNAIKGFKDFKGIKVFRERPKDKTVGARFARPWFEIAHHFRFHINSNALVLSDLFVFAPRESRPCPYEKQLNKKAKLLLNVSTYQQQKL